MEEENKDRDPNDPAHPQVNDKRMNELSFLRPYLFNPPHQKSTMFQEASETKQNSDNVGGVTNLVLPSLPKFEEEDSEMDFDEEESSTEKPGVDDLLDFSPSSGEENEESYQDQLKLLFDQVNETERLECFFAVTNSLNHLSGTK